MTKYSGLTKEICERAWEAIFPAVKQVAESGLSTREVGTVIVLKPASLVSSFEELRSAEKRILFVGKYGAQPEADDVCYDYALAKAQVTVETGLTSERVGEEHPYLYSPGSIKWPGSTITAAGLIVAFSGVQGYFDEMISEWMASAIKAICRDEMKKPGGPFDVEDPYLS